MLILSSAMNRIDSGPKEDVVSAASDLLPRLPRSVASQTAPRARAQSRVLDRKERAHASIHQSQLCGLFDDSVA